MTAVESSKQRLAVLGAMRTPQAKAFGALADHSAVDLGILAVKGALKSVQVAPSEIDEVVFGNVAGPPDATNIARVIAVGAEIPPDRIAHTVNRNCGSGMESIVTAWQALRESRASLILAGGTESMSNIPMLFSRQMQRKLFEFHRSRKFLKKMAALLTVRPTDLAPVNGIALGLTDPTCGLNMGETAELLAQEFAVSREEQDAFALRSHQRAINAANRCFMSGEILPLGSEPARIDRDIGPRDGQSMEQLARLKPIFQPASPDHQATVTAGNSCPLTDGATALLLSSEQSAERWTSHPLGYVTHYAIAGCDPRRMGLGPVYATSKLLKQTGLSLSDFDLLEMNEAFAAQVIASLRAFGSKRFSQEFLDRSQPIGEVDPDKLNVHGGAIALGHPIGASGARIVMTLLRALRDRRLHRGLATLCIGGGQGMAMVVEAP